MLIWGQTPAFSQSGPLRDHRVLRAMIPYGLGSGRDRTAQDAFA